MRLLQPALMGYGDAPLFRYDNTADTRRFPRIPATAIGLGLVAAAAFWQTNWLRRVELVLAGAAMLWDAFGSGLTSGMAARAQGALLGRSFRAVTVTRFNRDGAWQKFTAALATGKPLPCGAWYMGGGHELLAERIADGFVYYRNPWGTRERMGVDTFKASLIGISLPADG